MLSSPSAGAFDAPGADCDKFAQHLRLLFGSKSRFSFDFACGFASSGLLSVGAYAFSAEDAQRYLDLMSGTTYSEILAGLWVAYTPGAPTNGQGCGWSLVTNNGCGLERVERNSSNFA
eukprot:309018-Chlamydomonas_euryale.AAC.1